MSGEPKDPAIKLFGKTIPLPEIPPESAGPDSNGIQETSSLPEEDLTGGKEEKEDDKETLEGTLTRSKQEDGAQSLSSLEDSTNPDAASGTSENFKTPSVDQDASSPKKASKSEEEQSETSNSQDKPLKKPDKILPCPRCNSMDTKFCYYNNYNVNQPRHFCKNCQRYWTAGGTMRNVPVGAGRRKNKSSASHYRHLTASEALQNVRIDVPDGVNHHSSPVKPNGTVLAFGSDVPLCESMASVLNLAEKTMRNGFHKPEGLMVRVPCGDGDRGTNHVNVSSSSHEVLDGKNGPPEFATAPNCTAFPPQIQCYPGAPWPYLPMSPPPFCPPGFAMPMPLYPAYWTCGVPGAWNIPWIPGPSSPSQTRSSGPNSPTLGKHSRDEHVLKSSSSGQDEAAKEANAEKCLWVPKTLRIDDPGEAAKSSIWATLGIKKDCPDSVRGGGLFKAFQSKGEERNHVAEGSPVMQANPAAFSRSLNFNESS